MFECFMNIFFEYVCSLTPYVFHLIHNFFKKKHQYVHTTVMNKTNTVHAIVELTFYWGLFLKQVTSVVLNQG